jgi:hypothetical protein
MQHADDAAGNDRRQARTTPCVSDHSKGKPDGIREALEVGFKR